LFAAAIAFFELQAGKTDRGGLKTGGRINASGKSTWEGGDEMHSVIGAAWIFANSREKRESYNVGSITSQRGVAHGK